MKDKQKIKPYERTKRFLPGLKFFHPVPLTFYDGDPGEFRPAFLLGAGRRGRRRGRRWSRGSGGRGARRNHNTVFVGSRYHRL